MARSCDYPVLSGPITNLRFEFLPRWPILAEDLHQQPARQLADRREIRIQLVPCCQKCHASFCRRPQTMARQPEFLPANLSELEGERNPTHHHSAWGLDPPAGLFEYSPSGSTIELFNFQSSRQSSEITNSWMGADRPPAWHPKLTLYRLLVIFSTIGLGAAKAVTSFLNLTYASITLEWILGVVVFLG